MYLPENSIYLNSDGSVVYNASENIGGFQFNVDGDGILYNLYGGDAGDAGFNMAEQANLEVSFSITGGSFSMWHYGVYRI